MARLGESRPLWSTRKKDKAPRGVYRRGSGVWAIRYTCGAGHLHKEKVGSRKSEADTTNHERRGQAHREPGWCPLVEAQQAQARARVERKRELARVRFEDFTKEYAKWSEQHKRSWRTDWSRIKVLVARFGAMRLDEITSLDIERFVASLLDTRAKATANRYRDLLSGIFKRAIRDGHATANPVRAVSKFRESSERLTYLTAEDEAAVLVALPPEYRPHFTISVNTGLRWSEQMGLRWRDVDVLAGVITIPLSKNGRTRRVPINSVVRSGLVDLSMRRERPDDPTERVFFPRPTQIGRLFPKVVQRAAEGLRSDGRDTARLEGYVWHSNRHTFASRLVMAGVDLRTVQELGGWRTLAMVQRYAHLAPDHLRQAVERIVAAPVPGTRSTSPELARAVSQASAGAL